MQDWRQITLTANMVRDGVLGTIHGACLPAFMAGGTPKTAALFSRRALKDGEIGAELLFSPMMAKLAYTVVERYGGTPCAQPIRDNTTVLIGSERLLDAPMDTAFQLILPANPIK